ncbi:MAG: SPOR domain-containing protein [Synergistaceae bacterium]|jgi:cell division septation protein DedD|nr:SPOR domain-containing protein [Synergistaceae bacterium]
MAATTRRARNYKEKNSGFTFGHFALPIAAVVALGLLFIGVKLFFLTPPQRAGVQVSQGTPAETGQATAAPDFKLASTSEISFPTVEPETLETTEVAIVLASPLTQTGAPSKVSGASSGSSLRTTSSRESSTAARPAVPAASHASSNANAKWGVQIGAFVNVDSASSLVSDMKKQGYAASISKVDSSGKTFHRVRVGAGGTRESADKLATELEQKSYPVTVVQMQ